MSRRIAAIEAELGEVLFLRGRRLTATRLALEIEAHAESMATAALRLSTSLAARKARRESELAITTSDALVPLLMRAIARSRGAPRVRILVNDEERELEAGKRRRRAPPDRRAAPLTARSSPGRAFGWRVPKARRARGRRRLGRRLGRDAAPRHTALAAPYPEGARIAVECDRLLALRDACVAGLGRAILPCFLATDEAQLERVSLLDEGTPLWLFVATTARSDPAQRAFLEQLARALKAEKGAWQ